MSFEVIDESTQAKSSIPLCRSNVGSGVCKAVNRGIQLSCRKLTKTQRAFAADTAANYEGLNSTDGIKKEPLADGNQELCLLNGVAASLGSGVLGWVIGFGSGVLRLKVKGSRLKTSIQKANTSSKTFGLMGGMYTLSACLSRKIRGKDDALNLAIAGCASGIALGWDGGPVSALQSCVGMGAFSWFFDGQRLQDKSVTNTSTRPE